MKSHSIIYTLIGIIVLILVAALLFGRGSSDDDTGQVAGEMVAAGLAPVETIDVTVRESFPVQVAVSVRGNLPDGCAQLGEVSTTLDRSINHFTVQLGMMRPDSDDVACTQALVPFNKSIDLDVLGLMEGDYTVDVNGKLGSFTLVVDNEVDFELDKGAEDTTEPVTEEESREPDDPNLHLPDLTVEIPREDTL